MKPIRRKKRKTTKDVLDLNPLSFVYRFSVLFMINPPYVVHIFNPTGLSNRMFPLFLDRKYKGGILKED
jgi:hypothetical protein